MNRLLGCAIGLVLASCAPQGARTDEFSDHVTIDSPHATDASLLGGPDYEWELQSAVGKAPPHVVGHRLLVWISLRHLPKLLTVGTSRENVKYRFAADDTAAPLPVVPIVDEKCRVNDPTCTEAQTVTVPVPDAALRAHVVKGYRVKLTPNDGDPIILSLAPALLAKQLTQVDNLVQGDAANATPRAPPDAPRLGLAVIAANATPFADPPAGVIVVATAPSSPAAAAGIEPGDVLFAINAETVRASGDLARIMAGIAPGSRVSLALARGGAPFTASVQL